MLCQLSHRGPLESLRRQKQYLRICIIIRVWKDSETVFQSKLKKNKTDLKRNVWEEKEKKRNAAVNEVKRKTYIIYVTNFHHVIPDTSVAKQCLLKETLKTIFIDMNLKKNIFINECKRTETRFLRNNI